ncbi:MAG: immunoglobulin-like domain-containing protein [Minisyncoccia bacterium]
MKNSNYAFLKTNRGVSTFLAIFVVLVMVSGPGLALATYDTESVETHDSSNTDSIQFESEYSEKENVDEDDSKDNDQQGHNNQGEHKNEGSNREDKRDDHFDNENGRNNDNENNKQNSSSNNGKSNLENNDHENGNDHNKITICHATHSESNPYVKITVSASAFFAHDNHQDDEDVFLDVNGKCPGDDRGNHGSVNEAPVLSLVGNSVESIVLGTSYVDLGATAMDYEDGDITTNVIATSTVNTNSVGTYKVIYNVSDSRGLTATPTERVVNVIINTTTNQPQKGSITFCLILADESNNIATSSNNLPDGKLTINLATTTSNIASTTIRTKIWDTRDFNPNAKAILTVNDSDCVTYSNLDLDTYLYSEVSVEGMDLMGVTYNDQYDHGVMTPSDFYPYGNINTNSDGVVIIGEGREDRTEYVYGKYKSGPMCLLPVFTSVLTSTAIVNQNYFYTLTASSTGAVTYNVASSTLPSGLNYSTSTNAISGSPTAVGTYNITLSAENICGINEKTLVLTVNSEGGGNNQGANLHVSKVSNVSSINASSTIFYTITVNNMGPLSATDVKVVDVLSSSLEFVSASTSLGSFATSTGIWDIGDLSNGSTTSLVLTVNVKSGTEGQKISNTALASSTTSDPDNTNNTSTSEVNVNPLQNPNTGNGGGGGGTVISIGNGGGGNGPIVGSFGGGGGGSFASAPITTGTTTFSGGSCNYLNDYFRRDFNNNSIEVTKLQAFLRIFEGATDLAISGVYDEPTINAVNSFQMKYKEDILTPWGHTAPTGYTYILTKKKVNEIFCNKMITLSETDQAEIIAYRNRGVSTATTQDASGIGGSFIDGSVGYGSGNTNSNTNIGVGANNIDSSNDSVVSSGENSTSPSRLTTLAGFTTTTRNIANAFTTTTAETGKKLSNFLFSLFSMPSSWFGGNDNMCSLNYGVSRFLNLVLLAIIALLLFLWNRQSKKDKVLLDELNKEVDLN